MLKLSKTSLKIVSKSKNRARIISSELKNSLDFANLEARLLENSNIKSARVNLLAKSIVINYSGNLNEILDFISKIELKKSSKFSSSPSKAEIYKSAAILTATNLIKDPNLNLALSLYGSYPLLKDGFLEFLNEGLTSKMLEALAVGVSLARKDYGAANGTTLLLNLGEYIEESTVHKSDDLIKELAKPAVSEVWVERVKDGKKELNLISANELKIGDIVVVGIGESIAVDGYIVEGNASVNQVSMTGEAEPVKKGRGDRVMSGTIVEEGRIKIWAELIGNDTATARIKKYIQASLNEKSQIGLKASKLANKLVPITLGLSGLSYLINKNSQSLASVLQADYSCALKLATPVAFKTSIGRLGKMGILVKGAKALENLASTDTFIFDKTGTLTYGELSVARVTSFSTEFSNRDLLNLTASAEEHYFHPVAEAIVRAAKEQGFSHIHHDEVEFIVAHGVKTCINQKEVIIGSRHFLEDDEKIDFSKFDHEISKLLDEGFTLLYIAYNGNLIGTISLKDRLRENAKDVILKLKKLGAKEIIMLTGDIESKAKDSALALGIDKFYANCLPTDKARIIEELKASGRRVAFIGDGINDAPSLVKADVGISMQKGADIAKATADIGLLKDDIYSVAIAKEIANKTMAKINTNFNITVGLNSAILLGATLGKLSPLQTAFLHNGTTIGLLLNSIKGVKVE